MNENVGEGGRGERIENMRRSRGGEKLEGCC